MDGCGKAGMWRAKRPGGKKNNNTFCHSKNLPCRRSLSTQDRKKKVCGAWWPLQGRMIEHVPLRCSLFTSTMKVQWRDSTHIWLNVVKCSHPFPLPLESLLDTFKHLVSHCLSPFPAYVLTLSQLHFIVIILFYLVHLFQTSLDFFFGMFFFFCNCSLFVLCELDLIMAAKKQLDWQN